MVAEELSKEIEKLKAKNYDLVVKRSIIQEQLNQVVQTITQNHQEIERLEKEKNKEIENNKKED